MLQQLFEMLSVLPFGQITICFVIAMVVLFALIGVNMAVNYIITKSLSLDHEDAPDVQLTNYFEKLLGKILCCCSYTTEVDYDSKITVLCGDDGWCFGVKSRLEGRLYCNNGEGSVLTSNPLNACFKNIDDALELAKKMYPDKAHHDLPIYYVVLALDVLLYGVTNYFTLTLAIATPVAILLGMRYLSAKVWQHSKQINANTERIDEVSGTIDHTCDKGEHRD